jgi:hypothetical protein
MNSGKNNKSKPLSIPIQEVIGQKDRCVAFFNDKFNACFFTFDLYIFIYFLKIDAFFAK